MTALGRRSIAVGVVFAVLSNALKIEEAQVLAQVQSHEGQNALGPRGLAFLSEQTQTWAAAESEMPGRREIKELQRKEKAQKEEEEEERLAEQGTPLSFADAASSSGLNTQIARRALRSKVHQAKRVASSKATRMKQSGAKKMLTKSPNAAIRAMEDLGVDLTPEDQKMLEEDWSTGAGQKKLIDALTADRRDFLEVENGPYEKTRTVVEKRYGRTGFNTILTDALWIYRDVKDGALSEMINNKVVPILAPAVKLTRSLNNKYSKLGYGKWVTDQMSEEGIDHMFDDVEMNSDAKTLTDLFDLAFGRAD